VLSLRIFDLFVHHQVDCAYLFIVAFRVCLVAGAMKSEISRLEQEIASLLRDIGTRTGDSLLLNGLVSSLKSQVETLRAELMATQRAHKESLSKVDSQWEDKMYSMRDSQSRNLENAFITCRKSHCVELAELTAKFDGDRKSLEDSILRISSAASAELKRAQCDLLNAAQQLQAEKDSHALSVATLYQQIEEDRQASEKKLGAELETIRATVQAAAEERERLACEGHDAVVVLMKDMHRKALGESKSICFSSCFLPLDTRLQFQIS
jgi:septal ring factor EnvC (AmiA/AmiB activator)